MKAQLMTILFAVSLATTVRAQDVLTLDAAVGIALDNNQMLRGADHARESANWGKLNAYTNFLPKVSLNSSVTQIDRATEQQANAALDFIRSAAGPLGIPPSALADLKPFAYHNTFSTAVTVVQPIYNGGAEIVGVQAADATHEKSQFSFEDAQQDVIARVKSSYLNVLKAQELVALAKESTDRTMRFLEMTRHREEVGMRTKTDVLRWEVQLASAQGSVINAENLLATSHLQLNEVLGVELTSAPKNGFNQ